MATKSKNPMPKYGAPEEAWETYFQNAQRPRTSEPAPSPQGYHQVAGNDYWMTGPEKGRYRALSAVQILIEARFKEHGPQFLDDIRRWFAKFEQRKALEHKRDQATAAHRYDDAKAIHAEIQALDQAPASE